MSQSNNKTIPSFITPFGLEQERQAIKRALFLDRDGVIVHDVNYLAKPEHIRLVHDVSALKPFQNDFRLIIITNQSGIARGYFGEAELASIHDELLGLLQKQGVEIDAIYYCPHHPEATEDRYRLTCDCRKPNPGMIRKAIEDFKLDPKISYMIGDKDSDIEAGQGAGVKTVKVESDQYESGGNIEADFVINNLAELPFTIQ